VVGPQRHGAGPVLDDLPAGLLRGIPAAPHTVVALELEEGPLFVSYPVGIDAAELREGMRLQLRWADGADRSGPSGRLGRG
jgi:hypothetical protein